MEDARSQWRARRRLERARKRLTAVLTVLLAAAVLLFLLTFFGAERGEEPDPSESPVFSGKDGSEFSENDGSEPSGGTAGVLPEAEIHTIVYTNTTASAPTESVLTMPVKGQMTSGYGLRSDPITGQRGFHPAIDLAAPLGEPILAVLDGVVSETGWDDTYGRYVRLWHGGGLETQYGHCSELLVSPGDVVSSGDRIALVGDTGRTTGPHLDFQVLVDGVNVDPTPWLEKS